MYTQTCPKPCLITVAAWHQNWIMQDEISQPDNVLCLLVLNKSNNMWVTHKTISNNLLPSTVQHHIIWESEFLEEFYGLIICMNNHRIVGTNHLWVHCLLKRSCGRLIKMYHVMLILCLKPTLKLILSTRILSTVFFLISDLFTQICHKNGKMATIF